MQGMELKVFDCYRPLSVQKKFWDGDGSLKLAFDDIFHTAGWSGTSKVGNLTIEGNGTWEGQRLKLNFSYRFGSKQIKGARNHETGIEAGQGSFPV